MKSCRVWFAVSAIIAMSTPSYSLAYLLALCSTEDGEYVVSVTDNRGNGLLKMSRVQIAIKDSNDNYVGAFEAEVLTGEANSYGGVKYVDAKTLGNKVRLEAPPLKEKGFRLDAVVGSESNKTRIVDSNMQCSAFNRQLPGR